MYGRNNEASLRQGFTGMDIVRGSWANGSALCPTRCAGNEGHMVLGLNISPITSMGDLSVGGFAAVLQ
jgi:hypothetical protein